MHTKALGHDAKVEPPNFPLVLVSKSREKAMRTVVKQDSEELGTGLPATGNRESGNSDILVDLLVGLSF